MIVLVWEEGAHAVAPKMVKNHWFGNEGEEQNVLPDCE
jgi:hypothetical protein